MKDKLLKLHQNSYVPISHFPVSACVVTKDGREFFGVNVEDSSTRAGTCAERAAIFNAITAGVKKDDFKELYVMVSSGRVGTPCFVCMYEISVTHFVFGLSAWNCRARRFWYLCTC